MGDRSRLTRILCINCNICVNTLRRYPALALDARVISLLCSWVHPLIITEEDYVCEACKDLAMFAVNQCLQQEASSSGEPQAGPSHRGHTHVCVLCGCSILHRQSDKILRDAPTDLQRSIIAIIENRLAPPQVTESDRVCHACWLRTQREVRRRGIIDEARSHHDVPEDNQSSDSVAPDHQAPNSPIDDTGSQHDVPEDKQSLDLVASDQQAPRSIDDDTRSHDDVPEDNQSLDSVASDQLAPRSIDDDARSHHDVPEDNQSLDSGASDQQGPPNIVIELPEYRRAANTNSHCVFPHCSNTPLRGISDKLRAIVLSNHHYYLPELCRVCDEHLEYNLWETLFESENSIKTFTAQQIQHVFSFVNAFNPTLDFENIEEMDDRVFVYWVGYTKDKFRIILQEVPRIQDIRKGSLGLAILLLKMRTGDSDERISTLINMPRRTMETLMDKVREVLLQDFVPTNLGINQLRREELLQHNLLIPSGLYGNNNNAIVICDGTYIYIHKSSNYMFQKQSYSLHKYRNLLKPFMIVATDGYIIDCYGPYKATTSDADIMKNLFHDGSALRNYFREDDVFILDRGFRDSIGFLEGCGYRTCMPDSLLEGEHQLTTEQANRSCCVTICRWVVEAVNGHLKRDFKLLRQEYFHQSLPHMMQNFQIAAALLNKFGVRFQDNIYAREILEIIMERRDFENNLANMVNDLNMNRRTSQFRSITADRNNLLYFPTLEYHELILFALGTYQIRQARSYYGEHIRFHGGYRIEVSSEHIIHSDEYNLRGSGLTTLIRGKIKSRHVARRQYYVYILIENDIPGRTGIVEYCCSCLVGRRTLGCCAHVMTLVWYLGWARHQDNITAPAEFLDSLIVRDDDEDE